MLRYDKINTYTIEKSPARTKPTYLTELFDPEEDEFKLNVLRDCNFLIADAMEVPTDFCLGNIIASCLDYSFKESLFERANYFLNLIFSQPSSPHYTSLLMGLFDKI